MRLSENRLRTNQRIINVCGSGWGNLLPVGGVFALAVCLVLLFMIPVLRQEEGSVPDTGAQDSQQASVEETEQGSEEKEETQTPEERQPMTLDDYQQIQTELYAIGNTANKSIVTITGGGQ